jgi:hypothetical protein
MKADCAATEPDLAGDFNIAKAFEKKKKNGLKVLFC